MHFTDFRYTSFDGLSLHARVYGEETGRTPVVCLPGLTRNARDFHGLALHLATSSPAPRRVVAFDYRGRGASDHAPDWKSYDVRVEAADVAAGMEALGMSRAHVVGTSRGGLIAMLLAATRPQLLASVVLNDVGPVLEPAGLAHIRAYLRQAAPPRTFAEALAAQRAAHGTAFSAFGEAEWTRLVEAIYRVEDGRPVADFDPALLNTLDALDPAKPQPDLWPLFERLASIPVMAIRGENSDLLSAATLAEMARRHPGLETVVVAGQGHPPMLDTAGLEARIGAFMAQADARDSKAAP